MEHQGDVGALQQAAVVFTIAAGQAPGRPGLEGGPGLQLADVLRHIEISGVTAPVLIDEGLKLAKQVAATTTPEAILLGPGAQKLYQGRINDFYLTPTRKQRQPTTRELRDALDAVLAGKAVAVASVPAAGCKISGLE